MDARVPLLPLAVLAALVSATTLALLLGAGRRFAPVDRPGAHRSHSRPTPRGGGLGPWLAMMGTLLGGVSLALDPMLRTRLAALAFGLLLVGAVGWLDDRHGLSIGVRLVAHVLAALAAAVAVTAAWPPSVDGATLAGLALPVLVVVTSINVHNFMDGADGLLAWQGVLVLGGLAYFTAERLPMVAVLATAGAAGTAAFLTVNFPRARIFAGDVGSGALGFAIGAASALAVHEGVLGVPGALILSSAFLVDGGCTLLSRMLRGRRFWRRHREHLYQWLIRGGWSHARTALAYAGWTLLVALPGCAATRILPPPADLLLMTLILGTGVALWVTGKRAVARAQGALP